MRTPWIVVLAVAASTTARAEGKPPLVVYELEAKGATSLQAQAATLGVIRGLRELDVFQVLSSEDVRNLLAIERQRQLLGASDGAGSLGDVSRALGAQHAVVGSVAKLSDSKLQVEIRLLDTKNGSVLSQKTWGPAGGADALASELPALAQTLVGPLLQEEQGQLMVQSSELGSEVLVDGSLAGSTPMKAAVNEPRGTHRVQVRRDGFIQQSRPVRIEPNQLSAESFLLVPSPDYAEAWKLRHGRLRIGAYVASAVAVGALLTAVLVNQNLTQPTYNQKFVPLQYALQEKGLPSSYASNVDAQNAWLQCGQDTVACKSQASSLQGQLILDQALTIGLSVVAAGAAAAAVYLWTTGQDPNRYAHLVASVSSGGPGFVLSGAF